MKKIKNKIFVLIVFVAVTFSTVAVPQAKAGDLGDAFAAVFTGGASIVIDAVATSFDISYFSNDWVESFIAVNLVGGLAGDLTIGVIACGTGLTCDIDGKSYNAVIYSKGGSNCGIPLTFYIPQFNKSNKIVDKKTTQKNCIQTCSSETGYCYDESCTTGTYSKTLEPTTIDETKRKIAIYRFSSKTSNFLDKHGEADATEIAKWFLDNPNEDFEGGGFGNQIGSGVATSMCMCEDEDFDRECGSSFYFDLDYITQNTSYSSVSNTYWPLNWDGITPMSIGAAVFGETSYSTATCGGGPCPDLSHIWPSFMSSNYFNCPVSSGAKPIVVANYSDICEGNVCSFVDNAAVPTDSYIVYVAKILGSDYLYTNKQIDRAFRDNPYNYAGSVQGLIKAGYRSNKFLSSKEGIVDKESSPYTYLATLPYLHGGDFDIGTAYYGPVRTSKEICEEPVVENKVVEISSSLGGRVEGSGAQPDVSGKVISVGPGQKVSYTFHVDTKLNLSAIPEPGWRVVRWMNRGVESCQGLSSCSFTVFNDNNNYISVLFERTCPVDTICKVPGCVCSNNVIYNCSDTNGDGCLERSVNKSCLSSPDTSCTNGSTSCSCSCKPLPPCSSVGFSCVGTTSWFCQDTNNNGCIDAANDFNCRDNGVNYFCVNNSSRCGCTPNNCTATTCNDETCYNGCSNVRGDLDCTYTTKGWREVTP